MSRKKIQNQPLTRTVLNPRSREVWRQTGREREFSAPRGSTKCGGLRANARRCWRFECAETERRKLVSEGLAEREGFEPPIRLPVCRISSAVHSTTLPPLQAIEGIGLKSGAVTPEISKCYRFATQSLQRVSLRRYDRPRQRGQPRPLASPVRRGCRDQA